MITNTQLNLLNDIYGEIYNDASKFLETFLSVQFPQNTMYRFVGIKLENLNEVIIYYTTGFSDEDDYFSVNIKYFTYPDGPEKFKKDLQKQIEVKMMNKIQAEKTKTEQRELKEYLRLKEKFENTSPDTTARWVKFNGANTGGGEYPHNLLEIGEEYELDHIDMRGWHTNVFLKDFPGKRFNSVNFDISEEYLKEAEERFRELYI